MTTVAAKPAAPGSWWLVLLGGLAGQAARVAEADRGRAALLATVSHDLRAPLAAAKAAVSGLRADDARLTADDRADLLVAAEESLDRLAHLAAGLLDVSRLQAGARAVFPRPAHVGEVVAAALEALGPQPKPVRADIPSGLPEVMTDPAIAERVIVNPVIHCQPIERIREMTKTQDIRDAVELELSYDPFVDISDITVKNINGEVALNGTVPSFPQYLEAAAAARRVSGVKNVHNHLEVVLPSGDYRDDAMLTTMANNALTLNISVPDGVEATAENGNLTLTGTVSYGAERTAAEDAVAGLTGVRNLSDDIMISNDADPVDVTVYVQDALDRNALILDDSDVTVDTDGNNVTLSGHVRTWAEHDAVVDAAWMAVGVYDVRDNLYVTG